MASKCIISAAVTTSLTATWRDLAYEMASLPSTTSIELSSQRMTFVPFPKKFLDRCGTRYKINYFCVISPIYAE